MYKRLQDTVTESRKIGTVSDFAYRCWAQGLAKSDWFGRLPAEPSKFLTIVFPNRKQVSEDEVSAGLDELADVRGEGLIHLYEREEGRFLVFHMHEKHSPTGSIRNKTPKYPAPPLSVCGMGDRCLKYAAREKPEEVFGSAFRFFKGLFLTDRLAAFGVRTAVPEVRTAVLTAVHPLLSSPVLSSHSQEKGGCGGEEDTASLRKLLDEFTSLTGRAPLYGVKDPLELVERLKGLLKVRGLEAIIQVMKEKTSECVQRTGRPPSTVHYFLPIFEDGRLFRNGAGARGRTQGATAPPGEFALPEGELARQMESRMAEGGPEDAR